MIRRNSASFFGAAAAIALLALAVGGNGSGARADSSTLLFEQAALDGVDGHLLVPKAQHQPPPPGVFHMILWQPNPNRSDGMLSPTDWKAGDKTGFYPSAPLSKHQQAFRDAQGSSTVQIDGDTVGVYINSNELPQKAQDAKMMITPEESFAPDSQMHPFAKPGQALVVTLDLQVPTAADEHRKGSQTYISVDLLFQNGSGPKLSYGCKVFHNGQRKDPGGHIRVDEDTQNMMVNSGVVSGNDWLTLLPGSEVAQSSPWRGWRTFRFAITEQNFTAALAAYRQQGGNVSASPADYGLAKFHLNAESHFESGPTELGWSMRHARITVQDASSLR